MLTLLIIILLLICLLVIYLAFPNIYTLVGFSVNSNEKFCCGNKCYGCTSCGKYNIPCDFNIASI